MNKEFTMNVYDGYINKYNEACFAGGVFECDVCQLVEGGHLDEEGYVIDKDGTKYDFNDCDVIVSVDLKSIDILDNEDGAVSGEIVSIIWKGDHYQLIVRTEEDEDFVLDTEWTYNELDKVSVDIKPENIKLKLVGEAKNYVKA